MYSKNGGKARAHSWTAACETIGALSLVVAQVYEHEFHRQFKIIHNADMHLGTLRFAHLPVGRQTIPYSCGNWGSGLQVI
jgi:hypothetical protein